MFGAPRLLPLAAAAVAIVLSTAACGSGNKSTATTTTAATTTGGGATADTSAWANNVCSAFVTWRTAVTTAGKSVAANPTKTTVDAGVASAKAATATLKGTLQGLQAHAPSPSAAAEAKTALQQLQGQLQNDVVVIQRTVASVPSGTTGASQAASEIKTGLLTMRSQIAATGKTLRSLPSGEAGQAFKNAPACKTL
jgi:hypothetical protein